MRKLQISHESWPMRGVFRISRGSYTQINVVVAEIHQEGWVGRGECRPYPRYGDTPDSVSAAIRFVQPALEAGMGRLELQEALPPGSARNALDCALWDLECKLAGVNIWQLLALPEPSSLQTTFTLSVDSPEQLALEARKHAHRPLLKLKLAGEGDLERVASVRENAPHSRLIVDANEAWTVQDYETLVPRLAEFGVELIEQPFPASRDLALADLPKPVSVCADESCHGLEGLAELEGLYSAVNIKLDKTGGLTEALLLKQKAIELGFQVMAGCMVSTSLGLAPAFPLAIGADFVDLDGPLLLAEDRPDGLRYEGGLIYPPCPKLWG